MVDFISSNLAAIALVLAGLCLLMIVMLQSLQVSRLKLRIEQLTGGVEEGDLETVLGQHLETVHQVGRDLDELTARLAILESSARHHFSHQGLVRFNPFPDTGGNQSFALALLNESEDGFIVSSLHSRTGTRIYAKVVSAGKADTSLSTEEQDAIDEARARRPARTPLPARSAAARGSAPAAGAAAAATGPAEAPAVVVPESKLPTSAVQAVPVKLAPSAPAKPVRAAVADSPANEMAHRAASDRTKGQEKPKSLPAPEAVDVDPERVERKPGR
ncbi:MAG: DUF4446 family protein [Candidatus Limnocylindrales bacterium]